MGVCMSLSMTGCATLFGGSITQCQRSKPQAGQPQREIRVEALILDIVLFWPGAIVDFATGAIYRPCVSPNMPRKLSHNSKPVNLSAVEETQVNP